jgi:hypothetical protein
LVAATRLRGIEKRLWQAETRRNRECLRSPRSANLQAIGWRKGCEIECYRAIDHTWCDMRVLLEFRIVARGQHATTSESELVDDGGRERSPLRWVGPRPSLVEKHDVAGDRTKQDALN